MQHYRWIRCIRMSHIYILAHARNAKPSNSKLSCRRRTSAYAPDYVSHSIGHWVRLKILGIVLFVDCLLPDYANDIKIFLKTESTSWSIVQKDGALSMHRKWSSTGMSLRRRRVWHSPTFWENTLRALQAPSLIETMAKNQNDPLCWESVLGTIKHHTEYFFTPTSTISFKVCPFRSGSWSKFVQAVSKKRSFVDERDG